MGLLVVSVAAAGPVLHENFPSDPAEDLRLGATTTGGGLPAAMHTPSGLVSAPGLPSPGQTRVPYGGSKTASSDDGQFHLDRLTTRPSQVQYDEPFRPSIVPFKRLYAFDSVSADGSFDVADDTLTELPVGGRVESNEDAFFADFSLELVAGVFVRIPSVGPGTRIIALEVAPSVPVEVLRDSAENWFARGSETRTVRVLMQLAIRRQALGSHLLPVGWTELRPFVEPLPEAFDRRARRLWSTVGVSRELSPAGAVQSLVRYFRDFSESEELPMATDPVDLFEELTQAKKGVCRHRSYAFAVVALSLGIPTRVVHNEAHAWVEVFDSELWHRVDLGGAATDLRMTRDDPTALVHRPPPDPYSWPLDAQPASRLSARAASRTPPASTTTTTAQHLAMDRPSSDVATGPGRASGHSPNAANSSSFSAPLQETSQASVSLQLEERDVLRGHPIGVSGRVTRSGRACPRARVDIVLGAPSGPVVLGSVATDARGDFTGQVTLPRDAAVGALSLRARLHAGCSEFSD